MVKRWRSKVQEKETWYEDKEEDEEQLSGEGKFARKVAKGVSIKASRIRTTTVIFVPCTKGGILIRLLQEIEEKLAPLSHFRIKYQEA